MSPSYFQLNNSAVSCFLKNIELLYNARSQTACCIAVGQQHRRTYQVLVRGLTDVDDDPLTPVVISVLDTALQCHGLRRT